MCGVQPTLFANERSREVAEVPAQWDDPVGFAERPVLAELRACT